MNPKYPLSRGTINTVHRRAGEGREAGGVERKPGSVYFQNRMVAVIFT